MIELKLRKARKTKEIRTHNRSEKKSVTLFPSQIYLLTTSYKTEMNEINNIEAEGSQGHHRSKVEQSGHGGYCWQHHEMGSMQLLQA